MIQFFWESVKNEQQPVVIYGTGNGADRLMDRLSAEGVKISGVFASDGFVRDRLFRGFRVMSLKEAEERFGKDMLILMGFGSDRPEVVSFVKDLCSSMRVACPRIPLYDDVFMDGSFTALMRERFDRLAPYLADDTSVKTLYSIMNYRITADLRYLFCCEENEDDTFGELLMLSPDEDYVDIGAYRGDSVDRFLSFAGKYSSITALEPDGKNYEKLAEHVRGLENVRALRLFASDSSGTVSFASGTGRGSSAGKGEDCKSASLDELCGGERVSFIKIDAEGSEERIIAGCRRSIERWRPKIKTAVYHRADDIWRIPDAVRAIRDDYSMYLRHYPAFPDWGTEMIFV